MTDAPKSQAIVAWYWADETTFIAKLADGTYRKFLGCKVKSPVISNSDPTPLSLQLESHR